MKSFIQKLEILDDYGVVYATNEDDYIGDYYISEFDCNSFNTDKKLSIQIYYNTNLWDTDIDTSSHFENSINDLYHHIVNQSKLNNNKKGD